MRISLNLIKIIDSKETSEVIVILFITANDSVASFSAVLVL